MLRIVAVADTHLFHDELVVPDGDVFVHAGDLCRGGKLREVERAATWINGLPHRHKIVVPGNHDFAFVRTPREARAMFELGIHVLEDEGVTIEGVKFWGSPWQPTFFDWAYNLPRGEALAEKWALIPDGTHVLVTHGPPEGLGDRSSTGGRQGCADLLARALVVKPLVHLFGHIHEDGGLFDRDGIAFVNCTTWECERAPTVIDVDVAASRIIPVSVPSRDSRT